MRCSGAGLVVLGGVSIFGPVKMKINFLVFLVIFFSCVYVRVCVLPFFASVKDHTVRPYYAFRLSDKVGFFMTDNRIERSIHR